MEPLYIVIGLIVAAVLAVLAFALRKKPETPALEAEPPPKELPEKPEVQRPKPAERPVEKAPSVRAEPKPETPSAEPSEPVAQPLSKPKRVAEPREAAAEAKPAESKPVESKPAEIKKKEEKPAPAEAAEVQVESRPPKPTPVSARPAAAPSKAPVAAAPARKQDIDGLRKGLTKVREKEGFFGRLKALFAGKKEIDPQILEQIEEVLLTSDVGTKTTAALLEEIRSGLNSKELSDSDKVWEAVRQHATRILGIGGGSIVLSGRPTVVMVVGVNGSGKTTTIGKLATKLKSEGKKVVLAAGDTFRAAAAQQLLVWGNRVGCEVVRGKDGANPGAVIFDAIQKAKDIGADVVLADTAGRLHTKANLMDELAKVARTMAKALEGAPHETLLVLDATNGQNAMQQAAMFKEALPLSGIVLTKLDGTAKGGVILGICAEHNLPVRYIGIGERSEDLRDFSADEFVEAMLGPGSENTSAAA